MKLVVFTGTRPNLVKLYAFHRACRQAGVDCVVAHTGQHYDRALYSSFLEGLALPLPDFENTIRKSSPAQELANITIFAEGVLCQTVPDATVVFGDVTSTMAAALASTRLGVPVAHVEAGARSRLFYGAEEINRRVTEVLAFTLFAHVQDAYDNLIRAGFPAKDVFLTGDIMKDSLDLCIREHGIDVGDDGYFLATVHRAENTDAPERLSSICRAFLDCGREVVFPVHPRTRKALERYGLWSELQACPTVSLLEPQGYVDMARLLARCGRVVSDSGGLRREAYMLGKPTVALTESSWVPRMVELGWEYLAGNDSGRILTGMLEHVPTHAQEPIFGDGAAADAIVRILEDRLMNDLSKQDRSTTWLKNQESLVYASTMNNQDRMPLNRLEQAGRSHVSVVIPCYNEQEGLPLLFSKLDLLYKQINRRKYCLELVLVNDNSSDATPELLDRHLGDRPYAKVVHNQANLGLGGAIKEGFRRATGDIIVTIDADTNYDQLEIPALLERMTDGVDIVTGSPFMEGGDWNYPFHRYVLSQGVAELYKKVLGARAGNIKTFTCGFRAYRREALAAITPPSDDFLFTAEILVRGLLLGYKVAEYPAVIYERKFGRSKLKTVRTAARHLGFLWRVATNAVPVEENHFNMCLTSAERG